MRDNIRKFFENRPPTEGTIAILSILIFTPSPLDDDDDGHGGIENKTVLRL